jgi:thioredoxin
MATVALTKDNFREVVTQNAFVVVDFWAEWCGPCQAFTSTYEAAAARHPEVLFGRVNAEEQPELAGVFKVRSLPTVMAFRERIGVFSQAGALPAHALDELVKQLRALDMQTVRTRILEAQARWVQPAEA